MLRYAIEVAALAVLTLSVASQRMVVSGKGESFDTPAPHDLAYYTADPLLRDDAREFCDCKIREEHLQAERQFTITSEVRPVGKVAGFAVVDVLYRVAKKPGVAGSVKWKSILVQTGADQYAEIYHLQADSTTAALTPSRVIRIGKQQVLVTSDSEGEPAAAVGEAVWAFDSDGPHAVDFAPVTTAISHRVSPGTFALSCITSHLEQQFIEATVQKADAECRACGILGVAKAHFRLRGPQVEATEVEFTRRER